MSRALIALLLAGTTTAVACGGEAGSRMTVERYAVYCEALRAGMADLGPDASISTFFDATEDTVAEMKRWNPPEELQEYHGVSVRALEAFFNGLKDNGLLELMQDLEEALAERDRIKVLELSDDMSQREHKMLEVLEELSELEDEVQRTWEDLSPATRQILPAGGCHRSS